MSDAWREVGSPHSSEEAGESRSSEGGDGLRSMRSRQLTFVFADSPRGGKGASLTDESAGKAYLLHRAKGMSTDDLIAPAADTDRLRWPKRRGTRSANTLTTSGGS